MYLMVIIKLLMPGFALAQALGYPLAWIVAGVLYLVCSAGYAGIFVKAGEQPAKAFVPVLNVWTACSISGGGMLLFAAYIVALAANCILPVVVSAMGAELGQTESLFMALTVFFYAYQCFRMAASFGKDMPSAAALLLLEPIIALVWGFGPAAYAGRATAANPHQPFNVENLLGKDSPFDEDMNLKQEYKDGLGRD